MFARYNHKKSNQTIVKIVRDQICCWFELFLNNKTLLWFDVVNIFSNEKEKSSLHYKNELRIKERACLETNKVNRDIFA